MTIHQQFTVPRVMMLAVLLLMALFTIGQQKKLSEVLNENKLCEAIYRSEG
jgi:hypothetical protein